MDNQTRARFAQGAYDNGQLARKGGHHQEAARHFSLAHAFAPDSPEPLLNLGNALRDAGDLEQACIAWRDAVTLCPWHHAALANLAVSLSDLEQHEQALALIERCLILLPDWFNGLANIEAILRAMGRHAESARWALRQAHLTPTDSRGWMAIAATLHRDGRPREALAYQKKAMDCAPRDGHVISAYAILLQELGFADEAADEFALARRYDPDDPGLRWNAALNLLDRGKLQEGWAMYEDRFAAGTTARRRHMMPPHLRDWQGQPMGHGQRLLVWREQGVGDEIMWASCYAHLPAGSIVECTPRLHSLFARSFPHLAVIPELNGPLPYCTHQIAIGSLPRLFRRSLGDFQGGAYLTADPWQKALVGPGRKSDPVQQVIGISWRSMRSRIGAVARGYPALDEWAVLSGHRFTSLQYDNGEPQEAPVTKLEFANRDLKNDFEAVAGIIASCDAVVSVGNTVAALAGALGVPTAMLMLEGDYTMLGTGTYPWAKSVTCFVKRAEERDWSRPMAEIAEWLQTI